jgi:Zn-dependent protease with chaperone function
MPTANRLSDAIPQRDDLQRRLARANRSSWIIVLLLVIGCVVLGILIDWQWVVQHPLFSSISVVAMAMSFASSILMLLLSNRKRVEHLKDTTRFGIFDKYRLQKAYRETVDTLGLPAYDLPVYVAADKSMNAYALHSGLTSLFKSLNGICLNRQIIHQLDEPELKTVIGHELGHIYCHYLVLNRFHLLTILFGSLGGIFASQTLGVEGFVGMIILFIFPSVLWFAVHWPNAIHSQSIEYLCDDTGAMAAGAIPSITASLKIGVAHEIQCAVLQQIILSKLGGNLDPTQLIEAVLSSIPYGNASAEQIKSSVEREVKKRSQAQRPSLMGLFRYIWHSEHDEEAREELEEQAQKILQMQLVKRLDWESLMKDPTQVELDEIRAQRLIEMIEANPNEVLFRITEEPGDSHPPLRDRILYLWKNRESYRKQSNRR